jgi:hypothetical protein
LNEIFIETDELNAIEQLGNIVTIVYGDDTIKLSVKTRTQMSFEDSRTKDKGQELKERLEQRENEKGGKQVYDV